MRNLKLPLLLALTLLLAAAPALAETTAAPPMRNETIQLEGMPETLVTTQYTHDGWFTIWYDASRFVAEPTRDGVLFTLVDNRLGTDVSLKVEAVVDHAEYGELILEAERRNAEMEGWTIREDDAEGLFPLAGEGAAVTGFTGTEADDLLRVYLLKVDGREVLAELRYPVQAAEGWGARMLYMLNTLEMLPVQQ